MTKIKICGITNEADALFCAEAGTEFLGFIFVPSSPRHIEPEKAGEIAKRLREKTNAPKIVGVFQNASVDYINEIRNVVALDVVQLHGRESDDDIAALGVPAIKTLHVGDMLPDTHATPSAAWLLFDTFDERRSGGTGKRFDWSLLAAYERAKPFFLSGGLTPENVVAAVSMVRPDAIDVASGVEASPGIKDHDKVARLFERVRRA
ncbi:MAG TPA: phosphoribosylanthranilate isomerase [Thermoanaerobaculia bacterium]|jgi:phosphoribosylanthranilate isomerase|nr:phosphoribosylanthranilate isomerase [Thermoanaerobaculia bacterium]